ncbi:MAG: hypothetical protein D6832_03860, partial [Alphaproteobacteria bacterium]
MSASDAQAATAPGPAPGLTLDARGARPLHLLAPDELAEWRSSAEPRHAAWAEAHGFSARLGETLV